MRAAAWLRLSRSAAFDEGIPLRAQALVYPMIDDRTALRDDLAGRGELTWSPKSNRFGWTAYLGREPRMSDAPEYAAPARRTDVAGLPPAWIGVGDLDVFYDEDVAYAEKLKAAGVPCELVTVPGMYHGADGIVQKAFVNAGLSGQHGGAFAYLPGRCGVEGLQFPGDLGTARRVDDFLHTVFRQQSHSSPDLFGASDHCHPVRGLVEEDVVTFGQMGDVSLVGEQMALAFRGEILERVAPGASAGHRVDGLGADDGIRLVIADHLPRARRFRGPGRCGDLRRAARTVPGIRVAMGSACCIGRPMIPSAISVASSIPRGPKTLSQISTSTGRGAARSSACSIRTGWPSITVVSPASNARTAVT